MYNSLIKKKDQVDNAWGNKYTTVKTFDLISNLVETVKVCAAFEKRIFEEVANARPKILDHYIAINCID